MSLGFWPEVQYYFLVRSIWGEVMTPILRWSRRGVGVLVLVGLFANGFAGCNDDAPPSDGGDNRDADQTADADENTGNYPSFDCVQADENNMHTCMFTLSDGGTETQWGTWCDGDCRRTCFPPTECPVPLVCKRHGVNYLCFPE